MYKTTLKQIGFAIFTFAVYTYFFNWALALLLIVSIGFHESCHLLAAYHMKLKTKGFWIIPFIGGVALVNDRYKSLAQQAYVVLAGPFGGGVLAGLTALLFYLTGLPWLAAAASFMCFINLFNLAPMSLLDGGQLMGTVTYSINRTVGFVCLAISTALASAVLVHFAPIIGVLVIFFGGSSVLVEYRNWKNYREGNLELCAEAYLNPPKPLRIEHIFLVLFGWIVTAGSLILLSIALLHYPEAHYQQFFTK